jgi:hypothetical protein
VYLSGHTTYSISGGVISQVHQQSRNYQRIQFSHYSRYTLTAISATSSPTPLLLSGVYGSCYSDVFPVWCHISCSDSILCCVIESLQELMTDIVSLWLAVCVTSQAFDFVSSCIDGLIMATSHLIASWADDSYCPALMFDLSPLCRLTNFRQSVVMSSQWIASRTADNASPCPDDQSLKNWRGTYSCSKVC